MTVLISGFMNRTGCPHRILTMEHSKVGKAAKLLNRMQTYLLSDGANTGPPKQTSGKAMCENAAQRTCSHALRRSQCQQPKSSRNRFRNSCRCPERVSLHPIRLRCTRRPCVFDDFLGHEGPAADESVGFNLRGDKQGNLPCRAPATERVMPAADITESIPAPR